ncbi:MAG: DUF2520 domain-containing protein [Saprospiraceae bacterium]|nr:DUF2520 domain-containing protein [Saprospiraceae bacterium]
MSIFIIGSGNVAWHLCAALRKSNVKIAGIYSRDQQKGEQIAQKFNTEWYVQLNLIPKNASIYLLCVSDDAIKPVSESLPKSILKSKIVAHTSGSKSMEDTLIDCKNGGVFYPLQTFTKGKKMEYKNIPFCINGKNKKTIKKLMEVANTISTSVQVISDEQRKNIHLSAVLINNFVNHLIYVSGELLHQNEIDPEILQPLLLETIQKQQHLGAFQAQTGPARRMDADTMSAHLDLLKRNKEMKTIYMAISKSIQKTYNKKK